MVELLEAIRLRAALELTTSSNIPSITRLASSPSRNLPTSSSDESVFSQTPQQACVHAARAFTPPRKTTPVLIT
jgi:hypothetical protein